MSTNSPNSSPSPVQALSGKRIVLCVAGGIAAYKSVELLRQLTKTGADVQVAMTNRAREFVGELTFQTLSGHSVFTNIFDNKQDAEIGHIRIADGADLVVIAPATANLIARLVAGRADDPVTAAALATRSPILLAPAMNVNMWNHPATRHNVGQLAARGAYFVGPDDGFLACKWTGSGRLSEPDAIVEAAIRVMSPQDLAGVRVTVSCGGTQEDLDPVRYLGNRSTGKMGHALALAASRRGASVTLVSAPTALNAPAGCRRIDVRTALEMRDAVLSAGGDIVAMAAAVADYRPEGVAAQKLKKSAMGNTPTISLVRNPDILAELGANKRKGQLGAFLIGFAAETESIVASAQKKLAAKGCDMIVANDVSQADRGFASESNAVEMVWQGGSQSVALAAKLSVAHSILDRALALGAVPSTAQEAGRE